MNNKERFDCYYHSCAGDYCCYNSWTEQCIYPKCISDKKCGKRFVEKNRKSLT